ncbi:DNA-binding protein [Hymenobacter terricola]|uniref:DNA-binding protein n=1 Tax=Hymenobacter terricola TaxID=2819236 RepID=UPI001B30B26F|nr:DNA-binding protein [Hymenobacter terricola]
MQPAIIMQAADFAELVGRITKLEAAEQARTLATTTAPDEVLSTARAAEYIGLSADALLRARRAGRIQGVRLNEKDWGFSTSALDKYPRRGHRAAA